MRAEHTLKNLWIKDFLKDIKSENLSPATIRGYYYDLNHFRNWQIETHGKELSIEKISEVDLAAYRHSLVSLEAMKVSTVNRRIGTLRLFFKKAFANGLIRTDPSVKLRFLRRHKRKKPDVLYKEELNALLRRAGKSAHSFGRRNYLIIKLILETGIRVGEINRLKVKDINAYERSGFISIENSKSGEKRELFLNGAVRRAVSSYLSFRKNIESEGYLFFSKRNKPLSLRSIQQIIRTAAEGAKIKRIHVTAETLRHTFISNFLESNPGQSKELAALLGYNSVSPLSIYNKG